MTLVCRQLREETAPYWVPDHHCRLHFSHDVMLDADALAARVRSWADSFGRQRLKYLQQVSLSFHEPQSSLCEELTLHYSCDEGVWLDYRSSAVRDVYAINAALAMLEPHVENVESDRQVLSLQGEAIVLALTSRSSIWVRAYTEWSRIAHGGKCE